MWWESPPQPTTVESKASVAPLLLYALFCLFRLVCCQGTMHGAATVVGTIGRIIDASCVGRPCRNDALARQERLRRGPNASGAVDTSAARCPPGGVPGDATLVRPASAARPPMAASTASTASPASRPRKKSVNVGVSGATPQQVQHIPSRGQLEDISMLDFSSGEEDG
eukprot:COSAG01_NODE_994_length_12252_cov_10.271044_9_plen_168_part_00